MLMEVEDIVSKFGAGEAVPRDAAIQKIGTVRDIAWWDMVEAPVEFSVDGLEPGEMRLADHPPATVWADHLVNRGTSHGLKLKDTPEVTGCFRYPDGRYGFVFGYLGAS